MKRRVGEEKLGAILVQAKCAAKNIRAQRDRLLQFQLLLQPQQNLSVGEGDADAPTEEVVDGLIRVHCEGLEAGARYLTACLAMTAQSGVPPSLPLDFAVISDEQLFARLLALRLPRRPVTQAQAFARLEAAFCAVGLNLKYCLTRCIHHLGHPKCDTESSEDALSLEESTDESRDGGEIGMPDPVATVAEDLAKIALSAPDAADPNTGPLKDGGVFGVPDPHTATAEHLAKISLSDPVAADTEDLAKINLSDPDAAATEGICKAGLSAPDAGASASGETPHAATIDMDQARTYLNHACTLADVALKHVDIAVTAISSCLDPAQVASISSFADSFAYTK